MKLKSSIYILISPLELEISIRNENSRPLRKKASIVTTTAVPPKRTSRWCAPIGTLTCAFHEISKSQSMCMIRVSIGKIARLKCCAIHRIRSSARGWIWSIRLLFSKVIIHQGIFNSILSRKSLIWLSN